jgi:hypothetical protein
MNRRLARGDYVERRIAELAQVDTHLADHGTVVLGLALGGGPRAGRYDRD